jgi:hypothetical protein
MPTCTGPSVIAAYKGTFKLLKSCGFKPLLQHLYTEATHALQAYMSEANIDLQFAPPHINCRNAVERAIWAFKNHFIAGLSSTNTSFPLNLWGKLLPQGLLTLNLIWRSRINPQLSAQAQVHGAFSYNRTPLVPSGTKVLIHEKLSVHGTWAPHAVDGWCIGLELHHYRCY